MGLIQYLKDTRGELNHVAWPTRSQTVIFTALVVGLSVLVSLYLGLFDYLFTTALGKGLEYLPQQSAPAENAIDLADFEQLLQEQSGQIQLSEEAPVIITE